MNRRALVVGLAAFVAVACNAPTPHEKASTWHPEAPTSRSKARPRFDGLRTPTHHWIDCAGCASDLAELGRALNVEVGLAELGPDGGYVSTPAPSYYLDGGIALFPDGGLYKPIVDEEEPHAHPTIAGRYRFDIMDRDLEAIGRILDGGLGARLPPPTTVLDPAWSDDSPR